MGCAQAPGGKPRGKTPRGWARIINLKRLGVVALGPDIKPHRVRTQKVRLG